jgi:hypothetical protein
MPSSKKSGKSTKALVSASLPDERLAEVGARFAGQKLIAHASTILPKVKAHPELATYGFDDAWCSAIESLVGEVEAASDDALALADDATPTCRQRPHWGPLSSDHRGPGDHATNVLS